MENNRNFLIAMALSIAVLVGWQYFVVSPRVDAQRQAEVVGGVPGTLQAPQTPAGTDQQNLPVPAGTESVATAQGPAGSPAAPQTREEALAASPRLPIDTPSVQGSINLRGARLDDLRLKNYHETVDDSSPTIVLLNPQSMPTGYFAEFGYVGQGVEGLPGPDTLWTVEGGTPTLTPETPVTLTATNASGLTFVRRISVDDNFMFTVEDTIRNAGAGPVDLTPYGRVVRYSKPEHAAAYVIFEGLLGVFGDEGLKEVTYSSIEEDGKVSYTAATNGWLGITDKYWAAAIVPDASRPFTANFQFATQGRPSYQTDYVGEAVTIAPGAEVTLTQRSFAGAKEVDVIENYEESLGIRQFGNLIDWGWFFFITRPMFHAIDWLYNLVGNFGVAIILVTLALKFVFFPLANKSYKSMARMKAVQPQLMELRDKFKDDRVKQQQEMMRIYKEEKINPAAGCWPILVQIPVFFALYKVLYVTIEMRHAPFFGWIQDLAAPDPTSLFNLFGLLPFAVPAMLHIGVWPILMGITMFIQMRLNPTPPDPTQQIVFTWMPVLFTFMLASFPAGLVIYWTVNNTLSIIQQSVIMKRHGAKIELWDNLRSMRKSKEKQGAAKG
ncbi:membrane protein insertase YidC [Antarcticirhabdus aurantiaca]|uniref:Membrane protein insertase YidC n=1 Tax=Antarcticirhabdus aurantiaca TaxID=2606717 RepID=A0ACD4NX54_9HYPH|nr:membrane protein insertase YidC [Antarcticirhabdus aurantiaca]WAJ31308.1 membrane protein insertase YidC [Jeongeuplla avenae]